MKTATGILIVSLLAIESFAVDFLLVRDGRNVWVRDSDPFAYESRVARLNGAESITDETGTYCLYEGVKYYDIDAEAEALRGPAPEVFVPMLNSDGEPVGTARLVVIEGSLAVVASTNSASPQKPWAEQKDQILSQLGGIAESKATAAAARIAIKQTVLEGELSQDELDEIAALWPPWESGVAVAVDEIYSYNSALYRVVQAHTTQADWTPDVTPALFAVIAPPGIIPEWVQPTGGHDAYQTGDRVTHNGHTWVSTVDANVWEPGVYGWTQEE